MGNLNSKESYGMLSLFFFEKGLLDLPFWKRLSRELHAGCNSANIPRYMIISAERLWLLIQTCLNSDRDSAIGSTGNLIASFKSVIQ